ncbi:EF-Tu/IF-2/RF-3 family GTPase [Streptomyces luteireticuli]|uniref:EF-Tu/IF-2/RF-3 family GTPase n=1 Tax=Streptomyces luteireticuli TaxID=173858 RepID=UPI0035587567
MTNEEPWRSTGLPAYGDIDAPLLIMVEDTIHYRWMGRRFVVTGRVCRGVVEVGEQVEIVGLGKTRTAVVGSIDAFWQQVGRAEPGRNVALEFPGLTREDFQRGQVLATPGSIAPYTDFKAEIYIRTEEEVGRPIIFPQARKHVFHLGYVETSGKVLTLHRDGQDLEWPSPGPATLMARLFEPVALEPGLPLLIRESGSAIADGVVTHVLA